VTVHSRTAKETVRRDLLGQTLLVLGGSSGIGLETARLARSVGADVRDRLPIHRVVGPADVAALAIQLMANTAITGATYDIDGGQQLLSD